MEFSDESMEDFRRIYRQEYGEEISVPDAREMGRRLITLYHLLRQPYPGEQGAGAGETNRGQNAPGAS